MQLKNTHKNNSNTKHMKQTTKCLSKDIDDPHNNALTRYTETCRPDITKLGSSVPTQKYKQIVPMSVFPHVDVSHVGMLNVLHPILRSIEHQLNPLQ